MTTTQLQKQRDRKKSEIFFPDDITVDILSRLPAKSALRCRLVCRRWRDLTSNLDFEQLHMRRSIPLILVAHPAIHKSSVEHFLLDKWWEPERNRLIFHRFAVESGYRYYLCEYWSQFSHGGLIVFQTPSRPNFVILNPASGENVRLNLSEELWRSTIYGVFFHPLLREYCTLWLIYVGWHSDEGYYKMLNLGSKPCWRDITNPWRQRVKDEATCPVLIGEYLYWLVKPEQYHGHYGRRDIMEFDTRSENFDLMHCPVPSDVNCLSSGINLLDIDGILSFVLISQKEKLVSMTIWKLKDRAQQEWVSIDHTIRVEECPIFGMPVATAIVGEQLVLLSDRRLYVCNLNLGTTRTFLKKKYKYDVQTFSHAMSLASLRNCKSKISMDKEGEMHEESNGIVPDSLSSTKGSSSVYTLVRQGLKSKEHKDHS